MKGKEAAQSARRKAEALEIEVLGLRERAKADGLAAVHRERGLKEETTRLSGIIERGVKGLAEDRINSEVENLRLLMQTDYESREQRYKNALYFITNSEGFNFRPEALTELAGIVGCTLADLCDGANRRARRMNKRKMNAHEADWEAARSNGLSPAKSGGSLKFVEVVEEESSA